MRRPLRLITTLVALVGLATGCGPPPELSRPAPPPRLPPIPSPSDTADPNPPDSSSPSPSPSPSSPRFDEQTAVPCHREPEPAEIISVLRRAGLLPDGLSATVSRGPLCAGDWQYAVVSVPERDPLHVVTEGRPGALTLVTAGTAICVPQVRVNAPPGIRVATGCVG